MTSSTGPDAAPPPDLDAPEASPGSDERPPQRAWGVLAAGTFGNFVEWFDWLVYGYFATIISGAFFPAYSAGAALLLTFSVFAVGFFMRPLGGLFLGAFGDRFGRRRALVLAIGLMAVGSLALALTPTYETIGIGAPIVLVIARLAQGFSTGGEFGSSSAFLVEHAPAGRRGYVGSFQQVSVVLGLLGGSGLAVLLVHVLTPAQLHAWGWRIPFAVGAVLAFATLVVCVRVAETPSYARLQSSGGVSSRPSLAIFTQYPKACARVFALNLLGGLVFYVWLIYMPTYAERYAGTSPASAQLANIIGVLVLACLLPLSGAVSDRIGRRPLLIAYAVGFAVATYPMLSLLGRNFSSVLVVELVGCILLLGWSGVLATVSAEQFPAEVRTVGIAFPYSLAVAIFGGTAPLIGTWLLNRGTPQYLAYYIIALAIASSVYFALMRETKDKDLL